MRIGVYPFASTGRLEDNLRVVEQAIRQAAAQKVRLLAFHECALCGYPPIESTQEEIGEEAVQSALEKIALLAGEHHIHVAIGTVRFEEGRRFNSALLFREDGALAGYYDKTALWGWDAERFTRGAHAGVFEVDGVRIGIRICYDVRFPESFRRLYQDQVELCLVLFSDTSDTDDMERYRLIRAHLQTRAVENSMTVVSVNSLSRFQTAPTAVIGCDGRVVMEAQRNWEGLLLYDYTPPKPTFAMEGRRVNSDYFLSQMAAEREMNRRSLPPTMC